MHEARALVTGASGFVGRHLGGALSAAGLDVHGTACTPSPPGWPGEWHEADVLDAERIGEVVGALRPEYVFHLAALTRGNDLEALLQVNVVGTENVLAAVAAARPHARVLVTGSAAEYGFAAPDELPIGESQPLRPVSAYGVSKVAQSLAADRYRLAGSLAVVRTRSFNLTGPGEPDTLVCSAFARQIAEAEAGLTPTVRVGNTDAERDFLDVRDAVRAYVAVAADGVPGEVYNVASGRATAIHDVLGLLLSHSPARVEVVRDEGRITGSDVPVQSGDAGRLREATGWAPRIELATSLGDLLGSWRERMPAVA